MDVAALDAVASHARHRTASGCEREPDECRRRPNRRGRGPEAPA